ncbi:hypothetical protein [Hymenobacter yonginensis]|uniref:DUF4190 domain-containing protein n=1 Tax=Hymenobacter yonginensis TaxID=748197 RepID=A0ABY7PJK5_9BACT|nr:hypothetical protein [Hymenobacter yonginensis]WBO83232.1 hypothetical protein O9Z63_12670 [Hymenobacter yonginensis]
MSWLQLLWPEHATLAQRLFRVVAAGSATTMVLSGLLPTSHNAFLVLTSLLVWVGGPCMLLFPFLASYLLKQAAARHAQPGWPAHLQRIASVLLLLLGIGQVLVLALFLLLMAVPFEFEPRTDGDSMFG